MAKLKCSICKKVFYGQKSRLYCSKECSLKSRRQRRHQNKIGSKEDRRKEVNKKYYLNTKYLLTNKYKEEQKHFLLEQKKEQEEKEIRRKEVEKNWKINNREKEAEYRRKTRIKIRGWFDDYKNTLKCEICGYDRCSEALDFHHKDIKEKEFNVGQALNKRGKEGILKEIKKCIVICANCHRELHYEEKQEKIRRQREEYLRVINAPKKIYYKIVEQELKKDWFKELQNKAKYNLARFGGNQFIRVDNEIEEKIDIKKILSKKIGIGEKSICRILQIYKRGTKSQKERARIGESSISKIWKELKPIRYS